LDERSRMKHPRLSTGIRQSLIAQIARLESLKDLVRGRFVMRVPDTARDLDGER